MSSSTHYSVEPRAINKVRSPFKNKKFGELNLNPGTIYSLAHPVSVAREGHGSAHLNRVADVAGHFKKGAGTWNEVENIQSGNTCHVWLLLES